ncbi:MAG: QueT transporter family protein [Lachnospiraceae bacterium]|nr:QueT transporter family protein [Lachnospiraceae bacterium]
MRNKKVLFMVQAAMIAAIYVVLTVFINAFNLASGAIQIRISEALTVLPFFTPAAVPGLFLGCLISNLVTGCAPWDVLFGSLATLLGALGSWFIAVRLKHSETSRILVTIPPIVANTLIIPFVLAYVYQLEGTIPFFMLTVGAGELISCGILGFILLTALHPVAPKIFGMES